MTRGAVAGYGLRLAHPPGLRQKGLSCRELMLRVGRGDIPHSFQRFLYIHRCGLF